MLSKGSIGASISFSLNSTPKTYHPALSLSTVAPSSGHTPSPMGATCDLWPCACRAITSPIAPSHTTSGPGEYWSMAAQTPVYVKQPWLSPSTVIKSNSGASTFYWQRQMLIMLQDPRHAPAFVATWSAVIRCHMGCRMGRRNKVSHGLLQAQADVA